MENIRATGYLRQSDAGAELTFERKFDAPIADVWANVTESARTEGWIGVWEGDPRVGGTVTFTMTAEASAEPEQVTILECAPPHRLQAEFTSEAGTWHLQLDLQEIDGVTTLTFAQLVDQGDDVTRIGPGWDYYLDRLVASRGGLPMPTWDEYYPELIGHYAELG